MLKKLLACFVFLLVMVSSAYAESYMWAKHESNAGLKDGHSDYSKTRFSQIYVAVAGDNIQPTQDTSQFPGTFTISGGNYSFWNGNEMKKVSNTPQTLKLGPEWNGAYELYKDDGYRTRLCLEADGGLNGIGVSWNFPSIPSLNGQAAFPNYRTTQEQLASFVPYIEFIRSGNQVTGLKWRVVNPSDTSRPVSQDFDMQFQVENTSREYWNEFYRSDWVQIPAGMTPEGTLTFNAPVAESEIWLVQVNLMTHEDEMQKVYSWKFSPLETPEMSFWCIHESEAQLINGKSDYSKVSFYGLALIVDTNNAILAEAKHFTNEGYITVPGGGYTLRDGWYRGNYR